MMNNRQDFVLFVEVTNANPNGDPNAENRPRTDYDGYGLITDVCIKRKIRDRLQAMGNEIFYKSSDKATDGFKSLKERFEATTNKEKDASKCIEMLCNKFIDVRAFGAMCAFDKTSIGIKAPVTISMSSSIDPVDVVDVAITKSMNSDKVKEGSDKGSDTMGNKSVVAHGIYKICMSVSVELANKYGLTDEDLEVLKEAIRTMFVNDASAARPAGSMELLKCFFVTHDSALGVMSPAKVFKLITFENAQFNYPTNIPGLSVNVVEGF